MDSFNADTTGKEAIEKLEVYIKGKVFLITGTSKGGIGAETAITLATAKPQQIILASRNREKIAPVIDEIKKSNSTVSVEFVHLDLLDNNSVRQAAQQIKSITPKIDVLINNAGVMAPKNYSTSKDGIEAQFAACHIGHFLLTNLLIKEGIVAGEGSIIVNVGSLGYQLGEVNFDDINFDMSGLDSISGLTKLLLIQNGKNYNGWRAYGQAKTSNLLFTHALSKRLAKKGIPVVAVHPGVIVESQLLPNSGVDEAWFGEAYKLAIERNDGNPLPPQTTKSLSQGAACVLFAALSPSVREKSPVFLVENDIAELKEYATSEVNAEKLWAISEKLVDEKFGL
ncbi:MAG: hypothetical protein M1820_009500 [Bogoriella megaspora]|nr:MAG: hypothetical protein M1820_009500 [Bogoriella megaspora]